jgi:hypothetical protein
MKIVAKKKLLDIRRVQDVFTERNVLTRSNHPYLLKLHHTQQMFQGFSHTADSALQS